jgi:hypothetical protein
VADFNEEKQLGRLYAELFPGPDDHLKHSPATATPKDEDGRRIHELYAQMFPQKQTKGETPNVTPEQQANVDKALSETWNSATNRRRKRRGARPVPNEPTPLDKARDVGQDLHKRGRDDG